MPDTGDLVALMALGLMLVATAYTELKDKRIPNWVTMPGLAIGFLVGYFPGGLTLTDSVVGFLIGFGFLFVFYMFGGMGGGDVKLMGAAGALMGPRTTIVALVYTSLIGGVMAILLLIWNGKLLGGLIKSLLTLLRLHKPKPVDPEEEGTSEEDDEDQGLGTIPYGLAIICGCLAAVFLRTA